MLSWPRLVASLAGIGLAGGVTASCSLSSLNDLKGGSDAGTGNRALGTACIHGSDCKSGFCADKVCCDSTCDGLCMACSFALTGLGASGKCAPVTAGSDPRDDCADESPASCGHDGKCNGQGACRKYAVGVECKPQSCGDGVKTLAGACDGTGKCNPGALVTCEPKFCNGIVCSSDCPSDAACQPGQYCDFASGKCTDKLANGAACQAAKANECQSGFCSDGVCCDAACDGACQACVQSLSGAPDGHCSAVPAGSDPDGDCADQGAASCGADGACDGDGACRKYASGTPCGTASCSGSKIQGQICDGNGTCQASGGADCAPYACSGGACAASCGSGLGCASGAFCDPVLAKCQNNGPGCRTGPRQGFSDIATFPNIASCGATLMYSDAVTQAGQTCDDGWHMCTPAEIAAAPSATPDGGGAWVSYTAPDQQDYTESSSTSTCATVEAAANLAGTSGCTANGAYPEGWRLALSSSSWGHSHETSTGCIPHLTHVCAFPGGSAIQQYYTTCCR